MELRETLKKEIQNIEDEKREFGASSAFSMGGG